MNWRKFLPLPEITASAVVALLLHLLFFHLFKKDRDAPFLYSIPQLYACFFCGSFVILFILILVKQKNIDSVGNTFMLLTCVKMVLAYVLLYPILKAKHPEIALEKANFFMVFAIFLTLETIITIRMLNKN
ncbi:MAG TPA: hypothetical protein VK528_04055 [Flavobacterium sp.]|nr:hypothetical protein [Flavobacterium sp.]